MPVLLQKVLPSTFLCKYSLLTGVCWIVALRVIFYSVGMALLLSPNLATSVGLNPGSDTNQTLSDSELSDSEAYDDEFPEEDGSLKVEHLFAGIFGICIIVEFGLLLGSFMKWQSLVIIWIIYAFVLFVAILGVTIQAFQASLTDGFYPLIILLPHGYSLLIVFSVLIAIKSDDGRVLSGPNYPVQGMEMNQSSTTPASSNAAHTEAGFITAGNSNTAGAGANGPPPSYNEAAYETKDYGGPPSAPPV